MTASEGLRMDPFGGQTRVPPERATPEMTHFGTVFRPLGLVCATMEYSGIG